jgi:glucose/arabinose dehydrogenase
MLKLWSLFTLPVALAISFKSPVTVAPGFTADVISNNLTAPRGVIVDEAQNVLVVERGVGVSAFSLENGAWVKTVVVQNSAVTHGIELDEGRLLVSTASEVTAYFYDAELKTASDPFTFVSGLPSDGGEYLLTQITFH